MILCQISCLAMREIVLHRQKENSKYTFENSQQGNLKEVTKTKMKKEWSKTGEN